MARMNLKTGGNADELTAREKWLKLTSGEQAGGMAKVDLGGQSGRTVGVDHRGAKLEKL